MILLSKKITSNISEIFVKLQSQFKKFTLKIVKQTIIKKKFIIELQLPKIENIW